MDGDIAAVIDDIELATSPANHSAEEEMKENKDVSGAHTPLGRPLLTARSEEQIANRGGMDEDHGVVDNEELKDEDG